MSDKSIEKPFGESVSTLSEPALKDPIRPETTNEKISGAASNVGEKISSAASKVAETLHMKSKPEFKIAEERASEIEKTLGKKDVYPQASDLRL